MSRAPLAKNLGALTPDRLFWWIAVIGATATSVLLGAFFFYWLHFGSNKPSASPSDWGPFGDFIGGVTNPILSLFALLSLLLTLVVQSKQLEAAREQLAHAQEAASKQIAHLELQAKKTDLHRALQVLEARLERLYREPIYLPLDGKLEQWELYLLLAHATPAVLRRVPSITDVGPPEFRNEYLRTKATLTQLHITLVKFSMQLTSLVHLDRDDQVVWFYEPTIGHLAEKLKEVGYLPADDEATIEHNRAFRNELRTVYRNAA